MLAIGFLGLRFLNEPPQITTLFTGTKPGTVTFNAPEKVLVNQPFKISVEMDTKKQNVNAAGIYLTFEPSKLKLVNIDTTKSFCQFYPEKKYDNTLGKVTLACGSPHPGVNGKNTILTLEFMPVVIGKTIITFDPKSQLLLSNGKGTNILTDYPKLSLIILNAL